jgi:hypothetical protein
MPLKKSQYPICPSCGINKSVIPIMYGLPDMKLMRMHEKGEIHHHGCVLSDDMPEWHCKKCGNEWGKIEI